MSKFAVGFVAVACAVTLSAFGQNKVVFDNQSGDPALVKLIGPTKTEVQVPNGAKTRVDAAAGKYIIKVRYGTVGNYRYSKGQEFEVTETPTTRSEITITLHKVVAGNYDSRPIGQQEFEAGNPPTLVQSGGQTKEIGSPVGKSVAKPLSSEGRIRLVNAHVKGERSLTKLTSFGVTVTMKDASVGKRFLLVSYTLDPPAALPPLPEDAVSWSKQPPPASDDGPTIMAQRIKELRSKYQTQFAARAEAEKILLPVLISTKGERLHPVNEIGTGDWSTTVISGSKGFFVMEDEAIFEVPAELDRFTLQVEGYRHIEITPEDMKAP